MKKIKQALLLLWDGIEAFTEFMWWPPMQAIELGLAIIVILWGAEKWTFWNILLLAPALFTFVTLYMGRFFWALILWVKEFFLWISGK